MDRFLRFFGLQRIRAADEPSAPQAAGDGPPPAQVPRPPRRSLLLRLFAISPWGAVKLLFLSILVGLMVLAAQFDPRAPDVDPAALTANIARNAWAVMVWTAGNVWQPALAGAGIVLPIWVLWRLISLPFRR